MLNFDSIETIEKKSDYKYEHYRVKDTLFTVLERYEILESLRSDSYGVSVAAKDNADKEWYDEGDEMVSIKKLINIYDQQTVCIKILRQLRILRLLGEHENIDEVVDIMK